MLRTFAANAVRDWRVIGRPSKAAAVDVNPDGIDVGDVSVDSSVVIRGNKWLGHLATRPRIGGDKHLTPHDDLQ